MKSYLLIIFVSVSLFSWSSDSLLIGKWKIRNGDSTYRLHVSETEWLTTWIQDTRAGIQMSHQSWDYEIRWNRIYLVTERTIMGKPARYKALRYRMRGKDTLIIYHRRGDDERGRGRTFYHRVE